MAQDVTSREVIRRCVRFEDPPRFGLYFNAFGRNDTACVLDFFTRDELGVDPWGLRRVEHPDVPSIGMIKDHPVRTEADLDRVTVPDPRTYADKVVHNLRNLSPEDCDKYRFIATSSGLWEQSQNFRGMERLFEDMVLEPALAHGLVDLCADFWVAFIEELRPVADELDALYMFDDWGTQDDIMISRPMWCEFFAEPYRRVVDAVHANGMDFWLHSCGRVTNLIADFIDVGMDLINPYQSGTCGYEHVAEHFAGKVAFLTTVDTQSTLPHGTCDQIIDECRRLEKWGTPHGGLIAAGYGYDIPEENERVVFDCFRDRKPGVPYVG